ncbi:MAG: hypothetical protein ACREPF_11390 [Rhodanobacteraceae bacterium]
MIFRSPRRRLHTLSMVVIALAVVFLAGCSTMGTKLQRPDASIQQLTVNSDGTWAVVVRFQNNSFDTGMHVYAIDAGLTLNGKPTGQITVSPGLDIPAMDADIATASIRPEAAGAAVLGGAKGGQVHYELKGTLSVGKGSTGKARQFQLHGNGYISPVPGVSNIWR